MTPEIAELIRKAGGDPTPLPVYKTMEADTDLCFKDSHVGRSVKAFADFFNQAENPGKALWELVRHGGSVAAELLEEFKVWLHGRGNTWDQAEALAGGVLRALKAQPYRKDFEWCPEMPARDTTRRRLVVYIGPDTDDKLRNLVALVGMSLSRAVETAVEAWIPEAEKRQEVRLRKGWGEREVFDADRGIRVIP